MNRIDFINRLASLLSDIPECERKEAIQYYNDYLDDAGVENEEEVLRELGTPEEVAASIREGLQEPGAAPGDFPEKGGQQKEKTGQTNQTGHADWARQNSQAGQTDWARQNRQTGQTDQSRQTRQSNDLNQRYRGGRKKQSAGMTVFLVILCILAAPVILPLALVLLAVPFAIIFALLVVVAALLFAGIICIIVGVASFFAAFTEILLFPAAAAILIGKSIFSIGLGILMTVGMGWLLVRVFPGIFRAAVDFCSRLIRRKGGKQA